MAKREYIQRHLLIIKRLKSRPSSFEELHSYLLDQQYYLDENFDISQRTFQRDIKEIFTIFGVEIRFNKSIGKYEVLEEDSTPYDRLFESFEVMSALNLSNQMGNKILLERKADRGTEHLHGILYAIDHHKVLTFTHRSYEHLSETKRKVQPILVKEAQHRWYLICWDLDKNGIRNFGLDRISNLQITNQTGPSNLPDVYALYQHAIGIETYIAAETITIQCTEHQAPYLQSLPLHASQKLVSTKNGVCTFTVYVHPTHEFKMEVFKYLNLIEVVSPEWLRQEIAHEVKMMAERYGVY